MGANGLERFSRPRAFDAVREAIIAEAGRRTPGPSQATTPRIARRKTHCGVRARRALRTKGRGPNAARGALRASRAPASGDAA